MQELFCCQESPEHEDFTDTKKISEKIKAHYIFTFLHLI